MTARPITARLVLIGLDAADAGLVDQWTTEGSLPTLAALRSRGTWGAVTSPRALGDDGAWCTFATGVGPGYHGHRYHNRYAPGTYEWVAAPCDRIPVDAFWGALATQGKRFALVDVPKSPLGRAEGNVIVADWLAHHAHTMRAVVDVGERVPGLPGDGAVEPEWTCESFGPGFGDASAFIRELRERGAARTRVFTDLVTRDDFDAAIVVFGETHCAGHQAWHSRDVVFEAYRDVDMRVGEIVDACGPDAVVVVFSLLGMGPNADGTLLLDAVLRRLAARDGAVPVGEQGRRGRALSWGRRNMPGWARRNTPAGVKRAVVGSLTRDINQRRWWVLPADLSATPVRCNVRGREPNGKVEPGAEFERVCAELSEALLELRDPDTGSPLVCEVLRSDEIAPGPAPQDFADVHVVWHEPAPLTAATSPRIGEVRVELPALRTGNHVEGGWFVAVGPYVEHSVLRDPVSAVDFAPTVARLVGGSFDGQGAAIAAIVGAPPNV